MPQFPFSKYTASPASGVLIRAQGSHSPMVDANPYDEEPYIVNCPFKVKVFRKDNLLKASILPGTCNNIVPKIGSVSLDADEPPSLDVNSVGTKIIALKVTYGTPSFFPNTVEIVVLTSEEALESSNSNAFLQLASFNVTSENGTLTAGKVYQYIFSSQVALRFKPGSGNAVWSFHSR